MATATENNAMQALPRTPGTKNDARRVRVSGKIPAVLYGAGKDAISVTLDPRHVTRILHSQTGHNTIFDLAIRAHQGRVDAHRPQAHCHGQKAHR
jgi:large subunit ribosomal protein L25